MSWLLLALVAALGQAGREAVFKHAMAGVDEYRIVFHVGWVAAALLAPIVVVQGVPPLDATFWLALLVAGSFVTLATVLVARAVHLSDLSLVSPLKSFTPAFMLATSPVILGEVPPPAGAAGVLVIVLGAYLLNLEPPYADVLAPLRALLRDPGARAMLAVSLLYAVSGTVDKAGVQHSTPLFWGVAVHAFMALAILPWALPRMRAARERGGRGQHRTTVLLAGAITAVTIAAQMTALTLTLAAYVIAVKRLSVLFGVLAGRVLFREPLVRRLLGAAVMFVGLLLVTLS